MVVIRLYRVAFHIFLVSFALISLLLFLKHELLMFILNFLSSFLFGVVGDMLLNAFQAVSLDQLSA